MSTQQDNNEDDVQVDGSHEEDEQDTLVPDYIKLTEDERNVVEIWLPTMLGTFENMAVLQTVIEKLVTKIDQQNAVIEKTAKQLLELMKKINS